MSGETNEPSAREQRVNEAIAAYLEALDAGEAPAPKEYVAAHGDIAAELEGFFANRDEFERLAEPLQAAGAVAFAHKHGVIHRDLKPANVLLDGNDQPKVTDFGLAKKVEGDNGLTATGQILGTPGYMPPEQASGKIDEVTETADIYSLGAILYNLLTARPPFQADNPLDTLMQVLEREPASPRTLNPKVPQDLETICLKCLEKDRHRRYASAQELADELDRFLSGRPILARPIGAPARTWRWCKRNPVAAGLWGTGVALLLSLAVGGPILGLQQKRLAEQQAAFAKEQTRLRSEAEKAKEEEALQRARAEQGLYGAQIASAQREWELRNVDAAWKYLDACRWDLRGWEHDYLHALFTSRMKTSVGHSGSIVSVAFSPDGRRVVAGGGSYLSRDGQPSELKVWNVATGREELNLKGHEGAVTSVAFSPNGSQIVSASYDKTLRVCDATAGQETLSLKGHKDVVTSVAFSPDGGRIVSGSKDKTLKVWDATKGQEPLSLKGHKNVVTSVAFSPDGSQIVSGAGNPGEVNQPGELCMWDATTGQQTLTLTGHASSVLSVAFSPGGRRIVSGSADRTLKLWDATTGREISTLTGHTSLVYCVAFNPDDRRVASVGGILDMTIRVWDVSMGKNGSD